MASLADRAALNIDALVRRETALAFVLNATVSALLCGWIFGVSGDIPLRGLSSFHIDFIPHTFMTILMGTVIPGLIARRAALRAGTIGLPPAKRVVIAFAFRRAVTITPLLLAAVALCLALVGTDIPAATAITAKFTYGGVLAACVAPAAVRCGAGVRRLGAAFAFST